MLIPLFLLRKNENAIVQFCTVLFSVDVQEVCDLGIMSAELFLYCETWCTDYHLVHNRPLGEKYVL